MPGQVEPLGPKHLEQLKALLAREPAHNLYLLGLLEEFGIVPRSGRAPFAFYGRFLSGELTAAVFVGGNGGLVVPSTSLQHAVGDIGKALADQVQLGACVGEKSCVDALVNTLGKNRRLKVNRAQRLFQVSADDMGPFTNPTLRLATEEDVAELIPLAAEGVLEVFGKDPREEDPDGFPARVRQRVRSKRTYVLQENGRLVFKIDLGSRSQFGAELEGVFTLKDERRKGHATLCLGQISRHLLSSLPRLTLRVDDLDPGLAGVARKVGYVAGRAQRLVVMEA